MKKLHFNKLAYYFLLLLIFSAIVLKTNAQIDSTHFVTSWQTNNFGKSNSSSVFINIDRNSTYNYDVDWNNDGVFDTLGVKDTISHQYNSSGTYTIRIKGIFPKIRFGGGDYQVRGVPDDDRGKLISIDQWGTNQWASDAFVKAFQNCSNATLKATDAPDLSLVNSFNSSFSGASSFNGAIDHWDVSNIKNMFWMFGSAVKFNQDLNSWDVSKVTDMSEMFNSATAFNGNISNWDVSSVTDMTHMFFQASAFNQNISKWDVSKLTNMWRMFASATVFNQDIGDWDVSKVERMHGVFPKLAISIKT